MNRFIGFFVSTFDIFIVTDNLKLDGLFFERFRKCGLNDFVKCSSRQASSNVVFHRTLFVLSTGVRRCLVSML